MDEIVHFERPSIKERRNILLHYLVEFCQPPETMKEKLAFFWKFPKSIYTGKKLIRMEKVDNDLIEEFAKQTKGFSGRELFKMVVAWHDAAFSQPDPILTPELMKEIKDKFLSQHKMKENWTKDEELFLEKML